MGADAGAVVVVFVFMFMRAEADACADAGVDVDVDVDAGDAVAGVCAWLACVRPSLTMPSWAVAGACPCARAGMKPDLPPFTPPWEGDDAPAGPEAGDWEGDCRGCDCPAEEPAWRPFPPAGTGAGAGAGMGVSLPVFMFVDAGVDPEAGAVPWWLAGAGPAVRVRVIR